jgi:hypothetical protein
MANGRSIDRLAHRVASVTSVRPDRRRAQMAKFRSAAMILGPDRVLTWDLSSWYRVSQPVQRLNRPLSAHVACLSLVIITSD